MILFEEMINKVTPLSVRSAVIACHSLASDRPRDDSWTVGGPVAAGNHQSMEYMESHVNILSKGYSPP